MKTKDERRFSAIGVSLVIGLCIISYFLGMKHGISKSEDAAIHQPAAAKSIHSNPVPAAEPSANSVRKVQSAAGETVAATDSPVTARTEIESEQKQRLMRNLSENLAMPGMSRIIRDQQRVLMADQYRALIETYGLNEEEKEYFLDLLTARQMYHVDMGMKLMTGMLSDEEREQMLKRVGAGIDEVNKEIDWFLNNATDSEYFQYYDRTEGERAIVDSVSDQLSQAGSPLDEGMDRELIAIMHEQLSAYPFSVNLEENGEPVFSNFTSDNIDTFVKEMRNLRDPMIQQAAGVLTPEQLEVFAGSFDQYVAFYDQRLRMVQQLFNPAP